jgi:hypothetical protein
MRPTSPDAYLARIKHVPLIYERDAADGEAVICRRADGTPVRVTKPEFFRPEEREAVIRTYELFHKPHLDSWVAAVVP